MKKPRWYKLLICKVCPKHFYIPVAVNSYTEIRTKEFLHEHAKHHEEPRWDSVPITEEQYNGVKNMLRKKITRNFEVKVLKILDEKIYSKL